MSVAPNLNDQSILDPKDSISTTFHIEQNKNEIKKENHFYFVLASSLWLFTLSTPLIFFPGALSLLFASALTEVSGQTTSNLVNGVAQQVNNNLGSTGTEVIRQLNLLERSLASLAGISLFSLGTLLLIQTGSVPLVSSSSISTLTGTKEEISNSQFRTPSTLIITLFFSVLSYYSYDLNLWLITFFSGFLSIWGIQCILFGNTSRINSSSSKVSSYPFKNNVAEEKKAEFKKDL